MVKSRPQRAWRAESWVTYKDDNYYWMLCRWEWGGEKKTPVQTFSNRFLKTLTEGTVTSEAGSLFQYFTTLTENADPLLRRWLAPWSTFKECPLMPRRAGGRKNKFGSISKRSLNILKAVIRSARIRRRFKEWRPCRYSLSSYGR